MAKNCMQSVAKLFIGMLLSTQVLAATPQVNTSAPKLAGSAADNQPAQVETFVVPDTATPATLSTNPPPPVTVSNPSVKPTDTALRRIALLLPLRSENLGAVSEVIRSGFLAAWDNESDGVQVEVLESGEAPLDVLDNYQLALSQHDVLVGPLPRAAVGTLAESGVVTKPTVALNYPEPRNANEPAHTRMPANLLIMGLSIEEEARQAAVWASNSVVLGKGSRALIISSNVAWQKRAAKAFAQQWQKLGLETVMQEIPSSSGFLSAASLATLKNRLQPPVVDKDKTADKPASEKATPPDNRPVLAFVALDAEQTRQLRHVIGNDLPLFGTSQLNRQTLQDGEEVEPTPYLEGVRLLELPWQLQRDHPAVMIYPRLIQNGEQKRSADLERLYALGIDAYRVARSLALKPGASFDLDGVTGKLSVQFKKGVVSFERLSQAAMYRQGQLQVVPFGQFSQ